jgi:homoserine O-succinyltransferase/O-acetyltransferase
MPLHVEPARSATPPPHGGGYHRASHAILIGLLNNMPDPALEATEGQFTALLDAAAGPRAVRLRFSYLPGVPRGPAARERIERTYWSLEELLRQAPDALIVTGTEPRAASLSDEPYWAQFVEVLNWAEAHTVSSIWSCLAAHAAVEVLDGIRRQRLEQKRFGVFEHTVLAGHPLVRGVSAPLRMPHSRWNELPVADLRSAGYAILSCSPESGADSFVRQRRSLHLFFQGHPEYERTTLFKEYRRDVGRFLSGEQPSYPPLPCRYFSAEAAAALREFQERALSQRTAELLADFPAAAAAGAHSSWRPAALTMYRNWLSLLANAKSATGTAVQAQV